MSKFLSSELSLKRNTTILAFLDKEWPPHHSFVNGMLTDVVAKEPDVKLRLFVSKVDVDTKPKKYRGVACIPCLKPRRGLDRFKNLFLAISAINNQIKREKKHGSRIVLFVRNDPIYLLAASLMRHKVDRLIFQSSFPHEEFSGHAIKRKVAKSLYRIAGRGVDVVTGVTPEGVARTQRLCPSAVAGSHIPLLSDFLIVNKEEIKAVDPVTGPVFLYIGAHSEGRELEVVLEGIVKAVKEGAKAQFRFVGANEQEESRLLKVDGLSELIEQGVFTFERPVPREKIPLILSECDIGISLIPPKDVYYESSPTKLAEYMGAGLAVIVSKGIPMQERFLNESGGGVLVDWRADSFSEQVAILASLKDNINSYKIKSCEYAKKSLRYSSYTKNFRSLVGH